MAAARGAEGGAERERRRVRRAGGGAHCRLSQRVRPPRADARFHGGRVCERVDLAGSHGRWKRPRLQTMRPADAVPVEYHKLLCHTVRWLAGRVARVCRVPPRALSASGHRRTNRREIRDLTPELDSEVVQRPLSPSYRMGMQELPREVRARLAGHGVRSTTHAEKLKPRSCLKPKCVVAQEGCVVHNHCRCWRRWAARWCGSSAPPPPRRCLRRR